jgi:hypothetical protein
MKWLFKFGCGYFSREVLRIRHNLKVVGSNPTPATKFKARNVRTLAGFFARQFLQMAPQLASLRSAEINAFLSRIIV